MKRLLVILCLAGCESKSEQLLYCLGNDGSPPIVREEKHTDRLGLWKVGEYCMSETQALSNALERIARLENKEGVK